jgi:hypothetical protein
MKNRLTYSLPFSFKGENFSPRCTIDLDEHMNMGSLPCLYTHLANVNRIDVYSHEYDVMMMGDIEFEAAEGLAAEFVRDGRFDSEGFQARWHENSLINAMQVIASDCMGIDDLAAYPELKNALLKAFRQGQENR